MPANTAKGYPYPLGTDRLMDGDDAIHNLATAVDTKLGVAASGTAQLTTPASGNGTVAVTFPAGRFTGTPNAVACLASTASVVTDGNVTVTGVGPTGMTLNYNRGGANTFTIQWIAIQTS